MRMRNDKKRQGQAGFVQTAEILLIGTVLAIGLVTGLTKLRDQTVAELSDLGSAVGAIDQSYSIKGATWTNADGSVAQATGFGFTDAPDTSGDAAVGGDALTVKYTAAQVSTTAAATEAKVD